MKKIIRMITFLLTITLSVSFSTSTTIYGSSIASDEDDEVYRTMQELNELRQVYGLPSLNYSDELIKAASTHNKYMNFNDSYSSIEDSDKLYYRGRYPWDRASYAGYKNDYVFEALLQKVKTYSAGINYFLENPYSRYALLDPLYTDLGINTYNDYSTYLFGGSIREENYEVTYPYNGQKDVDVSYVNKYVIDPYVNISTAPQVVGVPITYSIYSSEARVLEFENLRVSMVNTRTNESVDIKVVTSLEDRNLTNSIMILPLEPYDYGTTYEVKINTKVTFSNSIKLNRTGYVHYVTENNGGTITFKTKETGSTAVGFSYVTRAEFVEKLMKVSDYRVRSSLEIIFPDVNINDPSYKYIYTAYVNKIIEGYGDGLYRPNANISRQQAYTILIRNYENHHGIINVNEDTELTFSDIDDISSWALPSLYKAKEIGLLIDHQYDFSPGVYITTSEFERMMEKYNEIMEK